MASLIVTSSCFADIYFNIVLIKYSGNLFNSKTAFIRNVHKLVLFPPAIIISFVFKPKDLFAEFNMFPEQIDRVSIMQFPKYDLKAKKSLRNSNLATDSFLS